MPLSPLDIKKKTFRTSLRGYDQQEVASFLEQVAGELDRLALAERELQQRMADLEARLSQYTALERNIQQALVQAQEAAAKTLEAAQREMSVKLREAELEAHRMRDDARRDADQILAQAQGDSTRLREEIATLRGMRDELVARIKAFLSSQAHVLRSLETDLPPLRGTLRRRILDADRRHTARVGVAGPGQFVMCGL